MALATVLGMALAMVSTMDTHYVPVHKTTTNF